MGGGGGGGGGGGSAFQKKEFEPNVEHVAFYKTHS